MSQRGDAVDLATSALRRAGDAPAKRETSIESDRAGRLELGQRGAVDLRARPSCLGIYRADGRRPMSISLDGFGGARRARRTAHRGAHAGRPTRVPAARSRLRRQKRRPTPHYCVRRPAIEARIPRGMSRP